LETTAGHPLGSLFPGGMAGTVCASTGRSRLRSWWMR